MVWPFSRNRAPEVKEHPNGAAYAMGLPNVWAPWESRDYIKEGYQLNVVVYRAITQIVNAAGAIEIQVYSGEDKVKDGLLVDLLRNPTPMMTWKAWVREMLVNRMLLGEFSAVLPDAPQPPVEMWPINPINVVIEPGTGGIPAAYVHDVNSRKVSFPVDQVSGMSDMLFVKTYNPSNYWRGQSPLMAAALAGDTHNAGMLWNFNLLKNSARPSGLIKFTNGSPGMDVINRLRDFVSGQHQGPNNSGQIAYTDSDMDWIELSKSAKDMDFLNAMKETAKYVAAALGVPLPLIDNEASTFSNMAEAKEMLYTDTVLPVMGELISALNMWLVPRFGDELELRIDMDTIPALELARQRRFDRAVAGYNAGLLTDEEARKLMGYPEEPDGGAFKADLFAGLPEDDIKALSYGAETKG